MKAIEIATKNHITMDDMLEVCKELEISCENDESDLSEKDVFLIEKKIEAIKKRKIENAEKVKKGKKIKLKRKVHVAKDGKEKNAGEPEKAEEAKKPVVHKKPEEKPAAQKKPAAKPAAATADKKEPAKRAQAGGPQRREAGGRPKRDDDKQARPAARDKVEAPAAEAGKDASKKRKKGKDKEKDKDRRKLRKGSEEKNIVLRKKMPVQPQRREVVTPDEINITENISVGELAKKLNVKAKDVIAKLMKIGVMATINQVIDSDTATLLSAEYGTEVKIVSLFDETVVKVTEKDNPEDYTSRPPVVTVMGHVDHGKTKLLDAIRKTDVTAHEHGGITQHIGAYMVDVQGKRITFLDTPGHEAFTTMRARGAKITDIVILVVAADDGVMPQTIEAINHAKDADIPIIVAINKIDLENANPQKVKQELSNYGLIPEEWSGTTLYAEISAKQNLNIDELLELIIIQSEMLELKSNEKVRARGTVIEAKLDHGRGSVSTILIQKGTLSVGDPFVVGIYSGKVRAMYNDKGQTIDVAGPSYPVEVVGISGVPAAGDPFEGMESDKAAKQISQKRLEYKRIESAKKVRKVTLESLNEMIKEGEVQEIRIIVKADVDGSSQALTESLEKLSTDEVRVKVIHAGTGGINESDVMLASASNALIIGYHVRPTGKVTELAEKEDITIKFYNVIFEVTDDIRAAMEGMLKPEIREEIVGSGEVRQIFKISKVGTIAGSLLSSGKIDRSIRMRLIRDGIVIYDGELKSLKRFKDDVKQVEAGQEFGFGFDGFNDIKEGDTFEAYKLVEIAKTL